VPERPQPRIKTGDSIELVLIVFRNGDGAWEVGKER